MQKDGFNIDKMPRTITCYICGMGFGTQSIGIHIKQCIKKF